MFSLQMPTLISPTLSSHHINEKPFSSLKFCSSKQRLIDGPNSQCYCPASSPISKLRLAAAGSASDTGIDDQKSVIQLPEDLRAELMPKHVAVIMDGNGRWAKRRGLKIRDGHSAGLASMKRLVSSCCKYGIKVLTVYAFSVENWTRSKVEVDLLVSLFEAMVRSYIKELILRKNIRFSAIGDRSRLSSSLENIITSAEESSKANKGMHFVMATSYSGRHEITEATKKIATEVEKGILQAKDINESLLEQQLMTNSIEYFPNPDLLIRTSGELRLSNFLLWQLAYTEFYFVDKLFPDFEEADFVEALRSFQRRQRRFGSR